MKLRKIWPTTAKTILHSVGDPGFHRREMVPTYYLAKISGKLDNNKRKLAKRWGAISWRTVCTISLRFRFRYFSQIQIWTPDPAPLDPPMTSHNIYISLEHYPVEQG